MMLTEPLQSLRQCPSTQVRATAHDQSSGFAPSVGVDYLNALPSVDCHLLIYSPAWGKHIWMLTPVYPGRDILWIQYAIVNLGHPSHLHETIKSSKPMKIIPFLEQHS